MPGPSGGRSASSTRNDRRKSLVPPPAAKDEIVAKGGRAHRTLPLGSVRTNERSPKSSHPPPPRPDARPSVAFIGLGAMGRPMAVRLVALGFPVRIFNRTRSVTKSMVGATVCNTPGECARGAQIVITMLSDAEALHSVLEGPFGILSTIADERQKPRAVVMDMSTIGRAAAVAIGKRVEQHGARFVDAPVSGSVVPAGKGELVALVGGTIRSVERVRPVLEGLCKKVIHAGGIGAGQTLKVVLNGLGAHHLVGFTSMLALGERAGLARDVVLEAFTNGAFATPSYVGKRDKLLARDYSAEFSLALALKDIALNLALQDELRYRLPVLRAILEDVQRGVFSGLGEQDLFALEKQYR